MKKNIFFATTFGGNNGRYQQGKRENNETPKECAIRELYEETGQQVNDLEFKGLIKVKRLSDGTIKYNPVYAMNIEKLQPFQQKNETSEIRLWDLKEAISIVCSGYKDF